MPTATAEKTNQSYNLPTKLVVDIAIIAVNERVRPNRIVERVMTEWIESQAKKDKT